MKRFLTVLFAAAILPAFGQSIPAPYQIAQNNATPPADVPPPAETNIAVAAPASAKTDHGRDKDSQASLDGLRQSNKELLDLLEKQQKVLEDIQYDRRLQNRQITLIEGRLEDTLQANAALQAQVAKLQEQAAVAKTAPASDAASTAPVPTPATATVTPAPPPPPATYLPAIEADGAPGTMWWHRLLTISGDDSKRSDVFHVTGRQWRVVWHNEDRPGKVYKNTSLLFINAFPNNDTIPKKICSQLGSGGGDTKEITGTGDFYLKVEASGGHWEAAVEDFR
jgi:hypothetical protein